MKIQLRNLGKRYQKTWIFRNVDLSFESIERYYAIVGSNGSGKSTLLQILSGILPFEEGRLLYYSNNQNINPENIYKYITWISPSLELIEEMNAEEFLKFYFKFKQIRTDLTTDILFDKINFIQSNRKKNIKLLSSGLKQRLKLALAFNTNSDILLLDEPATNLDHTTFNWYLNEVQNLPTAKIVIIASNIPKEYEFIKKIISIEDFKTT